MLVAIQDGKRIEAEDAQKNNHFTCPCCNGNLSLRKGIHNIPHFSHLDGDLNCVQRNGVNNTGESIIHLTMKKIIKQLIERDNNTTISEYEYPINDRNRIADYYCEIKNGTFKAKIAVECIHNHNDLKDFMEKAEYYHANNVTIFPIFSIDKVWDKTHDDFKQSLVPPAIMRYCYDMCKRVFVMDTINSIVYALNFKKKYGSNGKPIKTKYLGFVKVDDFTINNSKWGKYAGYDYAISWFNYRKGKMVYPYAKQTKVYLEELREKLIAEIDVIREAFLNCSDSEKKHALMKEHEDYDLRLYKCEQALEYAEKDDVSNLQYIVENVAEKQEKAMFWAEASQWETDEWCEYFEEYGDI